MIEHPYAANHDIRLTKTQRVVFRYVREHPEATTSEIASALVRRRYYTHNILMALYRLGRVAYRHEPNTNIYDDTWTPVEGAPE